MRSRLALVLIALSLGAPALAQEPGTDFPRRLVVTVVTRNEEHCQALCAALEERSYAIDRLH